MRNRQTGEYSEGGNAVQIFNEIEVVHIGNDFYGKEHWGKFVVQVVDEYGIWDEIENGIVDSEDEAEQLVEDLLEIGWSELRYSRI